MNVSFTRTQMLDALDAFNEGLPLSAQQRDALRAWDQKQSEIDANSSQQRAFDAAYKAYQLKVKERNMWIDIVAKSCDGAPIPELMQRLEKYYPMPEFSKLRAYGSA